MSTEAKTIQICDPCRTDDHLECAGTAEQPCECLVCAAQEIGDRVMGDGVGDYRKRRRQ